MTPDEPGDITETRRKFTIEEARLECDRMVEAFSEPVKAEWDKEDSCVALILISVIDVLIRTIENLPEGNPLPRRLNNLLRQLKALSKAIWPPACHVKADGVHVLDPQVKSNIKVQ